MRMFDSATTLTRRLADRPDVQQGEALEIRLAWARTRRQRAVMIGFDRLKRAVLPHLTGWPAPFRE